MWSGPVLIVALIVWAYQRMCACNAGARGLLLGYVEPQVELELIQEHGRVDVVASDAVPRRQAVLPPHLQMRRAFRV